MPPSPPLPAIRAHSAGALWNKFSGELYKLNQDRSEKNKLFSKHPEPAKKLDTKLKAILAGK